MAVLSGVPGLVASIRVNGQALTEHPDPDHSSSAKETVNYVESTPEKVFAVCLLFLKDFKRNGQPIFKVTLTIDGSFVTARLISDEHLLIRPYNLELKTGQKWINGMLHQSQLAFSSILTTESNPSSDARSMKRYQNVGLIKLEVFRVQNPRPLSLQRKLDLARTGNARVSDPIPEKALKGKPISQNVEYRTAVPAQNTYLTETDLVNPSEGSIATFKFKYRSTHDLKMIGIIPFSPIHRQEDTAHIPEYMKNEEGCSDEEVRDLKRQLKAKIEARANRRGLGVKREPRDEAGDEDVRPTQPRYKRRKRETIDLTGDSEDEISTSEQRL